MHQINQRPRGGDFALWLHLLALMAFWGEFSLKDSGSEVATALYCLLNVALVLFSVVRMRRVYAVSFRPAAAS